MDTIVSMAVKRLALAPLALAAACGTDPRMMPPDALALPDVMLDGPEFLFPDAGPIPVLPPPNCAETGETTVLVSRGDGTPALGVAVAFHDANGDFLSNAFTDTEGRALATLPPGGQVSVAYREDQFAPEHVRVVTWADLQPGACLRLRLAPRWATMPGNVMVLTQAVSSSFAVEVRLAGGGGACNSVVLGGEPTLSVPAYEPCVGPGGFVSVLGQVADTLTITVSGFAPAIDLPFSGGVIWAGLGDWRTDFVPWTLGLRNSSPDSWTIEAYGWPTRRGRVIANGLALAQWAPSGWVDTATGQAPSVDPEHDAVLEHVKFSEGDRYKLFARRRWPALSPGFVDAADLPEPPSDIVADDPSSPRPTLSWTGDAFAGADLVKIDMIHWTGGVLDHVWVVLADPGRTSFRRPELPVSFAMWQPPAGLVDVRVHYAGTSTLIDYADATEIEVRDEVLVTPEASYLLLGETPGDVTCHSAGRVTYF